MPEQTVVDIENLVFGWREREPLLDIASLKVEAASRVFVQGPSGCGKSTLLNLLGGVITPRSGRLRVLGKDIARMRSANRDRFRADNVGFIFQQFNLVPYLGVIDNVLLAAQFSPARRARAARVNGLRQAAQDLLSRLGLRPDASDARVTELSVGQQQRVAAARALFGDPALVIADEPTSSLDAGHRAAFLELLDDACRRSGATLVFVSHDESLASGFDRRISLPDINRASSAGGSAP